MLTHIRRWLPATAATAWIIASFVLPPLQADEAIQKTPAPEAQEAVEEQTSWGVVRMRLPYADLLIDQRPGDGRLLMPRALPQIVSAVLPGTPPRYLPIEVNQDASEIVVVTPDDDQIELRTCDTSQQAATGEIYFAAREAQVHGRQAKLESHPGNYRIGFWSNANDYVTWDYSATRWGRYRVLLTYSTASPDGTEIEVEMGGEKVGGTLKSTGSWYVYHTVELGDLNLAKEGQQTLTVRCLKKVGGAVMNLKAVILVPTCEGTPPVQAENGGVLLHGRDATVNSTRLRYEPAEKKQTLGYWTNQQDAAQWTFTLTQGGEFDVEVHQGCGTGQGGSEMALSIGEQNSSFTVEETGHFQNFRPRIVGRVKLEAGEHVLHVQPTKIAKTAACDIRQIRLIPVNKNE